jgi:hypothetical protein
MQRGSRVRGALASAKAPALSASGGQPTRRPAPARSSGAGDRGRPVDRLGGNTHCALPTYEGSCVELEPTLAVPGEAARSLEPGEAWTTRTGRVAWWSTPLETDPNSAPPSPERPREPTTTAAACRSIASSQIARQIVVVLRSDTGLATRPRPWASSTPSPASSALRAERSASRRRAASDAIPRDAPTRAAPTSG